MNIRPTPLRTVLFAALMLAGATAFAAQPAPQQHAKKKGTAEQTVTRQAETAAAVNATEATLNTAAGDMAAADREANRAMKDARMAKHAKHKKTRKADRRKAEANAVAADVNAADAAMRMGAADREAMRAAGDMQVAANAQQGFVQTAPTKEFTTPSGQKVVVRSIIPIAGKN